MINVTIDEQEVRFVVAQYLNRNYGMEVHQDHDFESLAFNKDGSVEIAIICTTESGEAS